MKWMVLLLLVLPVCYCNDTEIDQLETQMQKLTAEKAQLAEVESLIRELGEAKSQLSQEVGLISSLKDCQYVGESIETSFEAVPGPVLLKEFFFSTGTLEFTILIPSGESLSAFLTSLERTKHFVKIKAYRNENRPKPEGSKYSEYTVIFDYKNMPEAFEKQKMYESYCRERWKSNSRVSARGIKKMVEKKAPKMSGSRLSAEGLRSQIDALQKEIRRLQKIDRKKREMREEIKTKREVLEKLNVFLPEQLDVEEVIKKFQTLASKSNIKITKCSEKKTNEKEFSAGVSFSIELTGNYQAIVNFIRKVEAQKAVFVVPDIYMIFPRNDINSARVNTSLTLTTFVQDFE
jgi:Tfp pilus assembly protein PilO